MTYGDNVINVYFNDGTLFVISSLSEVRLFGSYYLDAGKIDNALAGKDAFLFMWAPNGTQDSGYCEDPILLGEGNGWEPYSYWDKRYWDSDKNCVQLIIPETEEEFRDILLNKDYYGCSTGGAYCGWLIKLNNWKIPDDYPIKL